MWAKEGSMKSRPPRRYLRDVLDRVRRFYKRKRDPEPELGSPDDPYALVGAPKKPRTPLRGAAVAEPLD
jgi:hypothetical protein